MDIAKLIKKLNDLLGADLGRNVYGAPLYSWIYSEGFFHHYFHPTRKELVCRNGIYVVERPICVRKMCPELNDQWLIALWSEPVSKEQWQEAFGDKMPWPAQGYLAPTNIVLDPGERPTVQITQMIIGMIHRERKRTRADYMDEAESAEKRKERLERSRLDDMVSDACTAFGNAKPGAVGNGISFPLVTVGAGKGKKTEVEVSSAE